MILLQRLFRYFYNTDISLKSLFDNPLFPLRLLYYFSTGYFK